MGFHRCDVVPCLYIRGTPDSDDYMVVCVHVDDGYIISKSEGAIDTFITDLMKEIHNATLYKPCQKYVGMEIIPDGNHVLVHQNTYIKSLKLLDITDDCHSEEIPMSNTMDLKDSKVNPPNPQLSSLLPVTGSLRYIADRTRPDVLVAVGEISSNATPYPSDGHIKTAKRTLRYLKTTQNHMLRLGGDGPIKMFGFSDASHITSGKSKSRYGGALYLGLDSGAFWSMSKTATTISLSSCESEIKAMTLVTCAIIHERDKLKAIGFEQANPTVLYTDSQSSVDLCRTLRSKENTKHVNVRINFLRECINNRIIEIVFIKTDLMVADLLTKPLAKDIFKELKYKLLYGFGGNVENISRHFTPMEQVYKEIDLRDAVLIGQIRTRVNSIKNNLTKRVRFSDEEEINSGQKYVDDL
jgi:hypothetical protein